MARFLPPDADAGDPNTVGGYQAVHGRPAAFEGSDGYSYSVEMVVDVSENNKPAYSGYLLFVRWGIGDPVAVGHVETPYLMHGISREVVLDSLGKIGLNGARQLLNKAIEQRNTPLDGPARPWYDVMNDS